MIPFMLPLKEYIRGNIIVGTRSYCWEILPVFGASLRVDTQYMIVVKEQMNNVEFRSNFLPHHTG